ncbi:MAG: hypothetical protein PVG71_15995, partial [Anaerolineae bacterium]|jgi:hypothetical protein
VLRGEIGHSGYKFFYFDGGALVGVLTVGRLGDARKAIPRLVKARLAYDDVADPLGDEGVELSNLIK